MTDFVFSTSGLLSVFRDTFSKPWNFKKENTVYSGLKKDNIQMLRREIFYTTYILIPNIQKSSQHEAEGIVE